MSFSRSLQLLLNILDLSIMQLLIKNKFIKFTY